MSDPLDGVDIDALLQGDDEEEQEEKKEEVKKEEKEEEEEEDRDLVIEGGKDTIAETPQYDAGPVEPQLKEEKPAPKKKRGRKKAVKKTVSKKEDAPQKLSCDVTAIIYLSKDDEGELLKSTLSTIAASLHEPKYVYIDDGGVLSAASEEQIKKYSRLYTYKEAVGAPKALNIALDSLQTTWYVVLQPGDVLSPGALDRAVDLIQKAPEKGAPSVYAQQPYTAATLKETPPDYPLVIKRVAWLTAGGYLVKLRGHDWRWGLACAMSKQDVRVCVVPGGLGHCSGMPDPSATKTISTEVLK